MSAAPAIITGIKTAATVLSAVGAAKSLFTKAPKIPSAISNPNSEESTPTVMPTEDSQAVAEAKRKALIAQVTRGGRASTVLTDTETFGGN